MAKHRTSPDTTPILQLLSDYSFDVESNGTEAMVTGWLQRFEPTWVSQAITEALYQGRYKVVSVDHILQFWQRRGQPLRHFNREFESIILGQSFSQLPTPAKVSPAPLNFSQGLEPTTPSKPGTDSLVSEPLATLPMTDAAEPSPNHAEATAAFPTSLPDSDATPRVAWPSSRSILPLTPDQLARLAETATPSEAPASEKTPSAAILPADSAPAPKPTVPVLVGAAMATTSAIPPTATADPEGLPLVNRATAPTPPTKASPETSLQAETIPNFQPVVSHSTVPSELTDSIPPFVPTPGPSDLHQRLKAVVKAGRQDN